MTKPSAFNDKPTLSDLKTAAEGKWHFIFEDLAGPELGDALAAAPEHVACPKHGGTDGFRMFEHYHTTGRSVCNTCGAMKSGLDTLMHAKGWSLTQAADELSKWLGKDAGAGRTVQRKPPPPTKPRIDPQVAYRKVREVWKGTSSIFGSPAETYLLKRGIGPWAVSPALRFHPGLRYTQYNKETKSYDYLGTFPALVAPVRNVNNELVTLHRIYLTEEGLKAPVPEVKKMMSQFRDLHGSAIRLFPLEDDTLGIAEGIETACAVRTISYMPMWAGVFATMLEQVEIPPQIKRVVVWADRDVSNRGIEAANALAERLEKLGLKVEVHLPPCAIPDGKKGVDWLDVLNQLGANGFPPKWRAWRPWHTLEPLKAYAAA